MTWKAIEKAGIGYLQLMPASLYSLTFYEFTTMLNGKRDIDEAYNREAWDQARFIALKLLSVHTKKGQRLTNKDVAIFPWDKVETKTITADERKEAFDKARKLLNKKPVKSMPFKVSRTGKII